MNLKKIFLSFEALVFVIGQTLAGFLNYLFQVYASRTMEAADFGSWSKWLAQFSVACFVGIWLQSISTISDLESKFKLKYGRWLALCLFFVFMVAISMSWPWVAFAMGWGFSLLSGFYFGANLRKKKMKLLALVSIIPAISRFVWVYFEKGNESFYTATLIAPFFSCLGFLFLSKPERVVAEEEPVVMNFSLMLAALSLAFFSTWVPQVDLLVIPRILAKEPFGIFAKVALLSKGFFFGFQILAQMLLAHQVQSRQNRLSLKLFGLFFGIGLFASVLGIAVAYALGFPIDWAFLSLLHITTLCLLYICIQSLAAQKRGAMAFMLSGCSVALAFLSATGVETVQAYWAIVIAVEILGIAYLIKKAGQERLLVVETEELIGG